MAEVIAADYGFTKTTSGDETTFIIKRSQQLASNVKLAKGLSYLVLFIVCAAPGACVGGDANSGTVGFFATVGFFIAAVVVIKLLRRSSKGIGEHPEIKVSPSTITIGDRAYNLSEARGWRIGNSRDERTEIIHGGAQAVVRDMATATAFYIAFSYGQQKVIAAANLSEGQADALFQQLMETHGRK
jgi:hypothetical protein